MINLFYHSHTVVPAHLDELVELDILEVGEQVLIALDGVLLDHSSQRLSGPTLHDYCLVSNRRILLWARDYGRHLCYAFPLVELSMLHGAAIDPLHAQINFVFSAEGEEDQHFALTLLPVVDLQVTLTVLESVVETAHTLADAGADERVAGQAIIDVVSDMLGDETQATPPDASPYRWPGAAPQPQMQPSIAARDLTNLPPGQVYTAGRFARSAWDTLRRSLREADLPIDLSNNSIRDVTEAVRAVNDLLATMANNPQAQQLAMAMLNRHGGGGNQQQAEQYPMPRETVPSAHAQSEASAEPIYHEIPLRRRGTPSPAASVANTASSTLPNRDDTPVRRRSARAAAAPTALTEPAPLPDRSDIPLRRRSEPKRLTSAPTSLAAPAPLPDRSDIPLRRRSAPKRVTPPVDVPLPDCGAFAMQGRHGATQSAVQPKRISISGSGDANQQS